MKKQIKYKEDLAKRYYGYAKRYARYSWSTIYTTYGDRFAKEAQNLRNELAYLIEKQGAGSKKVARVGIGVNEPQQTLHISGAMRLEPLEQAPKEASMGDIYVDQSGALCVYLNESWNYITGEGKCTE